MRKRAISIIMDIKYPIGIQNFETLRKGGYVYVDKTALIHYMVTTGKYYFLSRPRRFGKSLLLSTIESYYSGRKELFDGLAIEKLENEWNSYPILHIDLNSQKYDSPESLNDILNDILTKWEKIYGTEESEVSLSLRFQGIIQRAAEQAGRGVVILVDEYDKPILQSIGNKDLQDAFRNTLKAFYSTLKSKDLYIQFAMLTGVTKFSKISIFSDLNNLMDISMDNRYVNLCGITDSEIHQYFETEIYKLSDVTQQTYKQVCQKLKQQYDGYHFAEYSEGLYNPFSLLNTFAKMKFDNYWFETGTPTYLVELLKKHHYDLHRMAHEETDEQVLNSIDSESTNPIPVIYQSGYLTIKGYDEEFGMYRLGFPNREVEEGFVRFLLPFYANVNKVESGVRLRYNWKNPNTGIVEEILIECTETRDQPKNKERALSRLRTFIYDKEHQKYIDDIASKRKTMVSTGDRSAKIRTYNYPQGRITDHRINYTIYNLAAFMDGDIQDCIDHLIVAENAERLKESEL